MPRENLIKNLGSAYVSDSFAGAIFMMEGLVYKFDSATDDQVYAQRLIGDRVGTVIIPASKLKDFTAFAHPKLGYRSIDYNGTTALLNLVGLRSGRRGFRMDTIQPNTLPVYEALEEYPAQAYEELDYIERVKLVFTPEFSSVKMGIKDLLDGRQLGVALNHDTAIVTDVSADGKYPWAIYYREVKVGGIDENGAIVVAEKTINRNTLRKKLELV